MLLFSAELRTGLLAERVGMWARGLLILAALGLSVWGLKEILADRWSRISRTPQRTRSNRFMMPIEGVIYCVIMFVLLAGSVVGRSNTLMLVFSLMAGPFIMNGSIMFMMLKRLSVSRNMPPRVMAGEPFWVTLTLTNPKRLLAAWVISVRDEVSNGLESLRPEVLFSRVARRSSKRGQYQLRLSQRGRYSFESIQVNSRFPMGLVERGVVLGVHDEILVYPRIGRLTSDWQGRMISATQLARGARPRIGTMHDEFHRIREYRQGDDPRDIHWRTSARRNELMVREYRENRDRELILLLDLYLPANASEAERARFEFAISFAATIASERLLNGRSTNLSFAANSSRLQEWHGAAENGGWEQLLDMFAMMQSNPQAELSVLRDFARREQTPHSRTILISSISSRVDGMAWEQLGDADLSSQAWMEPPQVIVADPNELAVLFSAERHDTVTR
ncbi:MAG: DUF58 domain-containing protein [Planctomycetaceae bacterium]|nr:DUF58 domain-containing protein [Planctomycetaceae bacterium]